MSPGRKMDGRAYVGRYTGTERGGVEDLKGERRGFWEQICGRWGSNVPMDMDGDENGLWITSSFSENILRNKCLQHEALNMSRLLPFWYFHPSLWN